MGVQHNWASIEEFVAWLHEQSLDRYRRSESHDRGIDPERRRRELRAEGGVFDEVIHALESSNLATAKVAYNDEGLRGAASVLELTIGHAGNLSRLLAEVESSAKAKLEDLRAREGAALEPPVHISRACAANLERLGYGPDDLKPNVVIDDG